MTPRRNILTGLHAMIDKYERQCGGSDAKALVSEFMSGELEKIKTTSSKIVMNLRDALDEDLPGWEQIKDWDKDLTDEEATAVLEAFRLVKAHKWYPKKVVRPASLPMHYFPLQKQALHAEPAMHDKLQFTKKKSVAAYIYDRAEARDGKLVSEALDMQFKRGDGASAQYTFKDLMYDIKQGYLTVKSVKGAQKVCNHQSHTNAGQGTHIYAPEFACSHMCACMHQHYAEAACARASI